MNYWVTNLLRAMRLLPSGDEVKAFAPNVAVAPPKPRLKPEHAQIIATLRKRADGKTRAKLLADYKKFLERPAVPASAAPVVVQRSFRTRLPFASLPDATKVLENLKTKYSRQNVILTSATATKDAVLTVKLADGKAQYLGAIRAIAVRPPRTLGNHGVTLVDDGSEGVQFQFKYPVTPVRISPTRTANQGDLRYRMRQSEALARLKE